MIHWKLVLPTSTQIALAIWWGGLTFYAACVVPIGTDILGAEMQGLVTQRVTHWLNAIGWITVLMIAFQATLIGIPSPAMVVAWGISVLTLIVLQFTHSQLDALLAQESYNDIEFYNVHRRYLVTTTVQWVSGLILIWQTTRLAPSTD